MVMTVKAGDLCKSVGTGCIYVVNAVPSPDDPAKVEITRIRDTKEAESTSETVPVSELHYLPPINYEEFQLTNEANASIQSAVEKNIIRSTVFLAYRKQPLGTGTLVKCLGVYGVLTAWHCLHSKELEHEVLTGINDKHRLHIVSSGEDGIDCEIDCQCLKEILIGSPKCDAQWEGPDATFVQFPEDFVKEMMAGLTFVNVDQQLTNHSTPYEKCMAFITGFPTAPEHYAISDCGEITGARLQLMIMNAGASSELDIKRKTDDYGEQLDDEFEYLETRVELEQPSTSDIPQDFRGVSGGGVWYFRLFVNPNDGVVTAVMPLLVGVNYQEDGPLTDAKSGIKSMDLRCHYYNVLDRLLAKIKDSLS